MRTFPQCSTGFLLLFLAFSLVSCRIPLSIDGGAPTMTPPNSPQASITEIERWGRLTMPESAQDIQAHVDTGGLDALVVLTFKLPPDDLPSFLAGAGYSEPLESVDPEFFSVAHFLSFSDDLAAWPTDDEWDRMIQDPSLRLMEASHDDPDFHRSVLVDQTDPSLYTIYLVHFEVY
jgi:hypothetical protein